MKKSKIIFILLFSSTFLLFLNSETTTSIANPVPIQVSEFGGFIPKDDYSCFMPNASVLLVINATDPYSHFDLEFSGNYTLYNPNETLNLTIAAPFSEQLFGLNSTCNININGSIIPYEIFGYEWEDRDYGEIYYYYRNWIVCNVTLPMNKTIILEYQFNTHIESLLNEMGYMDFCYDFGTAGAWNGTITEKIEFKVYGQQPDSFSNYSVPLINFEIIEIAGGRSYIWELRNIELAFILLSVNILYEGNYEFIPYQIISLGNWYIIFLLLGFVSLLIVSERRVKQIRLKRQ